MNIFINILAGICCLIIGYLFGSIPTAVWIGKSIFHDDPRLHGSKNAGATNAGRIWGNKFFILIAVLDGLKGIIPIWICWAVLTFIPFTSSGLPLCASTSLYFSKAANLSDYYIQFPIYWLSSIGVFVGHCFPCFAQFKGGKGVAVFFGTAFGASWLYGVIPVIIFFLLLFKTKYVSLCSIICSMLVPILSWTFNILYWTSIIPSDLFNIPTYGPTLNCSFLFSIIMTLGAFLVVFRHRGNIQRLISGTERKFGEKATD